MYKNQREFIRDFNDKHREKFNPELFERSDDQIIDELKQIILSCQRNRVFTIRVEKFTLIKDYSEIRKILREYEAKRLKNKPNEINRYDYIMLKDSDVQLLIVDYYIEAPMKDDKKYAKNLRVLIEVPCIVDKYYYRLFGNLYSPTFQIIESTYNNSAASNSKSSMVTLKTMFMASRFYRFNIEASKEMKLRSTEGEYMTGVYYQSSIFNKMIPAIQYLLARFGLYGTMEMLKTPYLRILKEDPLDPELYTITRSINPNIYVSVPKYIYDSDPVMQSLVYTIFHCVDKDTTYEDLFTREYWLIELGKAFSPTNKTTEKGLTVLESLENIFDKPSKNHLHLPEEDKSDIYKVIVWVLREYQALRVKDNLDISMKRIRGAEYIAALYGTKVYEGLIRISDKGNKLTLVDIEKAINTYPDFLIKKITTDPLINYRNSVNDLDSISALKYTFKGQSGIGEGGTAIPTQYRQVHKSHLGRLDLTSVSSSDPGLSGMLCPMVDLYDGSFSQNPEPNNWRNVVNKMLDDYKDMIGVREALMIKVDLGVATDDDISRIETIDESLDALVPLMIPVKKVDDDLNAIINSDIHI